ncbi:MAG: hypothetical protein ACM319_00600 [Deltaproteobacteria bacterium]|nr:hypothetical protein [Candidatus Deferrimicrobiaceae bacterium]
MPAISGEGTYVSCGANCLGKGIRVETYIVRIYQRDKKDPKKVAGVVEGVGNEEKKRFLGPDSLWRILTTSWHEPDGKRGAVRRKRRGKAARTLAEIMTQIAKGKK